MLRTLPHKNGQRFFDDLQCLFFLFYDISIVSSEGHKRKHYLSTFFLFVHNELMYQIKNKLHLHSC